MHNKISLLVLIPLFIAFASCNRTVAKFSYPEKAEASRTLAFENTSENAEGYEWDFGDGNTSTEMSPTHSYEKPGDYTVLLKATRKKKVAEQSILLKVKERSISYIAIETNFGTMKLKLYNSTPKHRDNILKLAKEGFYDDLLFHRVIDGFMVQGGDPNSRGAKANTRLGSGGPGYLVDHEIGAVHVKGALAAARTNNPKKQSSGSQFYIVHGKEVTEKMLNQLESRNKIKYTAEQRAAYIEMGGTPFLDAQYTVYGEIVEGMDVLDKIAAVKTKPGDRPASNVSMKIRVIKE